jgi:nitroreductase
MTEKIQGYSREELLAMDISGLRALLHERTHHTIEVVLYRILKGRLKKPDQFGHQVKDLLDLWEERNLPTDTPDLQWCQRYSELAEKLNAGETIHLDTVLPKPFSAGEMKTVKKLLYERRSIRQFTDKAVPEWMVKEMLYAGLMSPQACNVDSRRFIILQKPEEWKLLKSDIPITAGVMIVVCQDMLVFKALKNIAERSPQNIYFDAASAADHICLMAHALGLGACWLTHGEETQKRIREYFGLPETFVSRCHIIVGWPDEAPIKSQRMALEDAIVKKEGG